MRPHILSDEAHRIAFGFSPPTIRYFARRLRDGLGERGARPSAQGPSGSSAPGKPRIRSASGQAAANARRMRRVVSTTRAAIFKSRRRSDANSAVANSRTLGIEKQYFVSESSVYRLLTAKRAGTCTMLSWRGTLIIRHVVLALFEGPNRTAMEGPYRSSPRTSLLKLPLLLLGDNSVMP